MLGIDNDRVRAPVAAAAIDPTTPISTASDSSLPTTSAQTSTAASHQQPGPIIWDRTFTLAAPVQIDVNNNDDAKSFDADEHTHPLQPQPQHPHAHLNNLYTDPPDLSPFTVTSDTVPDTLGVQSHSKPPSPLADLPSCSTTPAPSINDLLGGQAMEQRGVSPVPSSPRLGESSRSRSRLDTQAKLSGTKDEETMAKWRKWVVDQPALPKESISSSRSSNAIPMVPLGVSPRTSMASLGGPRSHYPATPSRRQSRVAHDERSPRGSSGRIDHEPVEMCNTDTARALRDVELAVDEKALDTRSQTSRRASTNPRISDRDNPFIELGSRLASRRVRPIVVELIQALGHYIDAIWLTQYPGQPCPWVVQDRRQSLMAQRRLSAAPNDPLLSKAPQESWKSRMLTAVQEGRRAGQIPMTVEARDIDFWRAEVSHSLKDVDEVVGIYKGIAYAFAKALDEGNYDNVEDDNVLGAHGEGGNIARLLNDLEEALWGDAPPRSTDLAYELPADFDPYADLAEVADSGPLSAFFSSSRTDTPDDSAADSLSSTPLQEEVYSSLTLPDLNTAVSSSETVAPGAPAATLTPLQPDPLGLAAYRMSGREMSLEEIGRLRHQEWLQSRVKVA